MFDEIYDNQQSVFGITNVNHEKKKKLAIKESVT